MRLRLNKLLALLLFLPALVMAQPIEEIEGEIVVPLPSGPADLFVSAVRPDDWIREEATDPNPRPVEQQRFVNFRGTKVRDILSPRREVPFEFTMVFMDDVVERVIIERIELVVRNGTTLRVVQGRVKSDELSRINLVFSSYRVRGTVHFHDMVIEMRPISDRLSVIQRIDPNRFPRELPPRVAHRDPGFVPPAQPLSLTQLEASPETTPELFESDSLLDSGTELPEIKVLLLKSDKNAGCDEASLNEDAQNYQDSLNDALALRATSQVEYRCIAHDETWASLEAARKSLVESVPISQMRKDIAADLVVLLLKDGLGACGYTMHPDYPLYPISDNVEYYARQAAFAIVDESCAASNLSLEHEIGHLLGMKHDRFNQLGGVDNFCGYGYPVTSGGFPVVRTIMAYDSYCTYVGTQCPRVSYYSFPEKKSGGPFGWLGDMFRKCFGLTKGQPCNASGVHHLDKPAYDVHQVSVAAGDVATYSDYL